MDRKKSLVLMTIAAALFLFGAATIHHLNQKPVPIELKIAGVFSMGKATAPIEIILIEDFKCKSCCEFSERILPKLQTEYIKSGIARFTLVPVSFLSGSQVTANAALEVYEKYPDRFASYLNEILIQSQSGEVVAKDLIKMAQRVGGIDLAHLQAVIEKGTHNKELERNLQWAYGIMGASFRTPALFVNGTPVYVFTFQALQERIEKIREKL